MSEAAYKKLLTYRFSLVIHDLTVVFCKRYFLSNLNNLSHLGRPDYRTSDQMIQAARSGKQNIVEGSEDLETSLKMAIKLTNVAKASLEELIADFEDFLRQREMSVWSKNDPRVLTFRREIAEKISFLGDPSDLRNLKLPDDPETAANFMLTLCHQATYLLHKQVQGLEKKHQTEGGFTEKLYQKRKEFRARHRYPFRRCGRVADFDFGLTS